MKYEKVEGKIATFFKCSTVGSGTSFNPQLTISPERLAVPFEVGVNCGPADEELVKS